ncbi:hypothetical protein XfCFBP8082_01285 [Xylella fastidiosa subsp. fastidiosa]|nr:hypothetical protein [Xylella fastidiosa subsp. multiplex]NBI38121.1 hypothetical protein [Xylella fastidiosa subsp. fastidiosa]QIS25150.1 hypothetical protein F7G16_02170 [Xylella fastidiosa]RWA34209.1 hypothetical protein XfCFBP7969_01920 [Xylella fastidiosa subsp. fastidiosa]RWA35786.1 hypothetical protein XfCFBP7970_03175 [Xylella fastidiosa subsp. fastidiosa]
MRIKSPDGLPHHATPTITCKPTAETRTFLASAKTTEKSHQHSLALQQKPPMKLTTHQKRHQSNDDATQHAHNTIKPETLQGQ